MYIIVTWMIILFKETYFLKRRFQAHRTQHYTLHKKTWINLWTHPWPSYFNIMSFIYHVFWYIPTSLLSSSILTLSLSLSLLEETQWLFCNVNVSEVVSHTCRWKKWNLSMPYIRSLEKYPPRRTNFTRAMNASMTIILQYHVIYISCLLIHTYFSS